MSQTTLNGLIAIGLGSIVAVLLLMPVAAYQYRKDGRLGPGDLTVLLSGAIYSLALWTYTLLPLPTSDDYRCKPRQLDPLESIRLIFRLDTGGALGLLRDPAFLQVALNVLLFVPLGFFVRRILRRGVVVATLLGLVVSLAIETTQATGVWHIFPCAYRLFDVDDLIVNTLGALLGSMVAAVFVDRAPKPVRLPTTVSFGRRLVGMVSDVLFLVLVGSAVALAYRAWIVYGPGGRFDDDLQTWLQFGVPAGLEAASVLVRGRTIGEWVVDTKTVPRRPRGPVLTLVSRLVKLALGIGPFVALVVIPDPWTFGALLVYAAITAVVARQTEQRRGLANAAAGLDLRVDLD